MLRTAGSAGSLLAWILSVYSYNKVKTSKLSSNGHMTESNCSGVTLKKRWTVLSPTADSAGP